MTADLYPLQVLLVTLAGWVNRHQQHVIEYLVEENRSSKGILDLGWSCHPARERAARWIEFLHPTGVPNEGGASPGCRPGGYKCLDVTFPPH